MITYWNSVLEHVRQRMGRFPPMHTCEPACVFTVLSQYLLFVHNRCWQLWHHGQFDMSLMRYSWALYMYRQLGGSAVDKITVAETAWAEVLEIPRWAKNIAPPAHAKKRVVYTWILILRLGSDCADVKAKLRILCSYMPLPTFSC